VRQDASETRAPNFGDRSRLGPEVRRIDAQRIASWGAFR